MSEEEQRQLIVKLAGDIERRVGHRITHEPFRGYKRRRCSFRVHDPAPGGRRKKEVFGFGSIKVELGCLRVSTWDRLLRDADHDRMGEARLVEGLQWGEDGWRWEICEPEGEVHQAAVYGLSEACRACLR